MSAHALEALAEANRPASRSLSTETGSSSRRTRCRRASSPCSRRSARSPARPRRPGSGQACDQRRAAAGLPAAPLGCGPGRPQAVHRRRLGRSGGPLRLDARRALPGPAGMGPSRSHRRRAAHRRSPGNRSHRGVDRDRDAFRFTAQVSPDRTGASRMSNGLGAFRVEPANALKPERSLSSHNYRLSAYERKEKDFYPTPAELGTGLALGLRRLGLYLPRVALGGDGALRRSLGALWGRREVERSLLGKARCRWRLPDARAPRRLRAEATAPFSLFGRAGCTAIITNTRTKRLRRARLSRTQSGLRKKDGSSISSRCCSDRSGELSPAGCFISTGRPSTAIFFAVGGPVGSRGVKEVRCMRTRRISGGRRHGAARL